MDERRFPRSVSELDALFEFVKGFAEHHQVDSDATYDLCLALEELFTNMVKYHPESTEAILLQLERDGASVRATLRDFDVDSWDVAQAPDADLDTPIEVRRPGGFGIHLVRRLTDSFEYAYRDRSSTITLTKKVRN